MFFEQTGKIVVVGKANVRGDLGEGASCVADLALGEEQATLVDVFRYRFARFAFKYRRGVFGRETDECREGLERVWRAWSFLYVTEPNTKTRCSS